MGVDMNMAIGVDMCTTMNAGTAWAYSARQVEALVEAAAITILVMIV